MAGCTLVASDEQALVSALLFEFITLPGLVGFTIQGGSLTLVTEAPNDLEAESQEGVFGDVPILTWLYTDRSVDVGANVACIVTEARHT